MSQYIETVSQEKGFNRFLTKTYGWMILGLLLSSLSAYVLLETRVLLVTILRNSLLYWGIILGQLALAYTMRVDERKLENTVSYMLKFVAYTLLTGITFAVVSLVYARATIVQAFVSTAGLFGLLTLFGLTTKRDLSKIGNMAGFALIGIIIVSLLNVFIFKSTVTELILAILTMIVFVGLTMWDTQRMVHAYRYYENRPSTHGALSIALALQLYLDFINLFLSILRIFGRGRD